MDKQLILLMQGDTLLGEMYRYDSDFPWIYCHFHPTPAFEPLRPLFQAELDAFKAEVQEAKEKKEAKDIADWEKAYERILALQLRILNENGKSYLWRPEGYEDLPPLIHIEEDKAWFR